jgi:hypothetical protein
MKACKILDSKTTEDEGAGTGNQFFDITETADENNLSD